MDETPQATAPPPTDPEPRGRPLWRTAFRLGGAFAGILLLLLLGSTELVRWLDLQFWQPWTCRPALNLYVFQREEGPFDVVFLGPSTLQRGILPEVLGPELDQAMGRPVRFFSVGQPGPKYRTYRTIARELLVGDHAPTLLVIVVGGELFLETEQTKDYFRYFATMRDLVVHRDWVDPDPDAWPRGRQPGLSFHRAALQGAFRGIPTLWQWAGTPFVGGEHLDRIEELRASRGFPELGWDIRYSPEEWRARMEARLKWYADLQGMVDLEGPEAEALDQTLAIVGARGIPTLVVQNTTSTVTEAVRKTPAYRRILQLWSALSERHGAEFLNLDRPELAPPTRMFNDPYHMNRDGAAIATVHWARKVLAPRLKRLERDGR